MRFVYKIVESEKPGGKHDHHPNSQVQYIMCFHGQARIQASFIICKEAVKTDRHSGQDRNDRFPVRFSEPKNCRSQHQKETNRIIKIRVKPCGQWRHKKSFENNTIKLMPAQNALAEHGIIFKKRVYAAGLRPVNF